MHEKSTNDILKMLCKVTHVTVQDAFQSIGHISCTWVIRRWGLLSHAKNALAASISTSNKQGLDTTATLPPASLPTNGMLVKTTVHFFD